MDSPDIVTSPTTEELRTMIRDELNSILPTILADIPRAKDILEIKELLQQAATKTDVANLQMQVDAQRHDLGKTVEDVTKQAQDIADQRQRISEGERKFDAFSGEITRGITDIKHNVTGAMTQMLEMSRQAFERNKGLEDRLMEAEKLNSLQSQRIASNAADVDDLRQRFTDAFNPVRAMIVGDETRPSLNVILTRIQEDVAINNTKVQTVEADLIARQQRNAAMRAFLWSRPGAILVGLSATLFIGLFSKVDFVSIAHIIQLLLGGK